jgi:hypothetical protein
MPDSLSVVFRDEVAKGAVGRRNTEFRYDNVGDVMRNLGRHVLAVASLATLWALPQGTALVGNFLEQHLLALRSSWPGTSADGDATSLRELAHSSYQSFALGQCYLELRGQHHHLHDMVAAACNSQNR